MTQETLTAYAIDRFKDLATELETEGISPQAITHALTQSAATIAGDLDRDDARDLYEALATIANRLNPTACQEF